MHRSQRQLAARHAAGLAAAFACLSGATAQEAPSADAWQFAFIPDLRVPGISSDLRLGPLPSSSSSERSSSVLGALDSCAMGTLEARRGPWGALLEMQSVKLGVSRTGVFGPLGPDADSTQQIDTLAGVYGVIDSSVAVDVLAGGRYVDAKTDVELAPNLPGPGPHASVGWRNGILGARVIAPGADRWSLLGNLDADWGSSTASWKAVAGASYQDSPTVSVEFGYRKLSFQRDERLLSRVALGGSFAGAGVKLSQGSA